MTQLISKLDKWVLNVRVDCQIRFIGLFNIEIKWQIADTVDIGELSSGNTLAGIYSAHLLLLTPALSEIHKPCLLSKLCMDMGDFTLYE